MHVHTLQAVIVARKMILTDLCSFEDPDLTKQRGRRFAEFRARNAREPVEWQEGHSETEPATVREYVKDKVTGALKPMDVTRPDVKRRKGDNRIWARLTPAQESAAEWIVAGWDALTAGSGYSTMKPERVDQGREAASWASRVDTACHWFSEWSVECAREDPAMKEVAIQWLVFHRPMSEIDRTLKLRKGTASETFFKALTLFAHLRGWK